MTTDTRPKQAQFTCEVDGVALTIEGIAKGSGMIQPNMATMLGFVVTNAKITRADLQAALSSSVKCLV